MNTTHGQRIRHLRTVLGLTQVQLATLIGAGLSVAVSRWEADEYVPSHATLRLLANLTDNPDAVLWWLTQGGPAPKIDASPRR